MPVVIDKINGGSGTVMRDLIYFVVASNNGTYYGWRLILRVWSIFVSINGSFVDGQHTWSPTISTVHLVAVSNKSVVVMIILLRLKSTG